MPGKLNCWEFTNCGREPGGVLADREGVCSVATALHHDGENDGRAGGRVCWKLQRDGNISVVCSQLRLITICNECAFYRRVCFETETIVTPDENKPLVPES